MNNKDVSAVLHDIGKIGVPNLESIWRKMPLERSLLGTPDRSLIRI